MAELTGSQLEARRRLLYDYIKFVPKERHDQYLVDVVVLAGAGVDDDVVAGGADAVERRLAAEARNPYNNESSRKKRRTSGENSSNPFSIASGQAKANEGSAASASRSGVRGRPRGTKNKPNHKAGGNRKSAKYWPQIQGQGKLPSASGDGTGQSDDAGDAGADDEQREEIARRREVAEGSAMESALEALGLFAESIPNGTIDTTPPDSNRDDGYESDGSDNSSGEGDTADAAKPARKSRSYKPKPGSAVREYLDGIRKRVVAHDKTLLDLDKGASWIPPPCNAISQSLGPTARPDKFYTANTWAFVFAPKIQFQSKMPDKHECIRCKSKQTRYYGWNWKPYHWWDKTVHVLHQRVKCEALGCGATFATIDPRALATLPTCVAEQFPFVLPQQRGPGYYAPMMTMLVSLLPHSVLFGTFANAINVTLRSNFAQTHLSYLDEAYHWKYEQPPAVVACSVPTPFSPFDDQMGYCGIELQKELLIEGLREYMGANEAYMQAAFQFGVDEGCSSDDSHKMTNKILAHIGKTKIKPFVATYSVLSLGGKPNISRFKFTKATSELSDIIPAWATVRANAGHKSLLRLEGDNAAGDSAQQHSASPSLLRDVVPYQGTSALPRFTIAPEDYSYVTTPAGCESIALGMASYIERMESMEGTIRLAIDSEYDVNGVHLLALAFEGDDGPKLLIHPYGWGDVFEPQMQKILERDSIVVIGVSVTCDIQRLRARFGIRFKRIRELRRYCLHDDPNQRTSLKDLSARYLGYHVDKTHQRSNFDVKPPLALDMRTYAMGDAILPLKLDDAITSRLIHTGNIDSVKYPPDLQPGTKVVIKIGGVESATAKLLFLGEKGGNAGESSMWGSLYIGANKALVEILSVVAPGAKVPFQHSDWGAGKLSLGQVAVKPGRFVIAVYASQIHKRLLEPNAPPAPPQLQETVPSGDATGAANAAAIEIEPSTQRGENAATGRAASAVQNHSVEMVGTVEDVGDPLTIRSREKSDRWHEHDNVPLPKDCPASPFVHQLLRHAAYAMNSAEYERVRATLAAKGIHDADSHFFFNRRYWMKRVRMPPRESDEASANLLSVLDFLKREDAFKEYVTEDFEKHVRGWARRCREGRYEDLPDVEMYTHDGCDSDGLDLWISRRGSKGENFHQKMRVAVGPFGISVETAHYLHVILAYFEQ